MGVTRLLLANNRASLAHGFVGGANVAVEVGIDDNEVDEAVRLWSNV